MLPRKQRVLEVGKPFPEGAVTLTSTAIFHPVTGCVYESLPAVKPRNRLKAIIPPGAIVRLNPKLLK